MRHCIYWDYYTDLRLGGPTGYLANLEVGLQTESPTAFDIGLDKWAGAAPRGGAANPLAQQNEADVLSHLKYFSDVKNFRVSDENILRILSGGTRSIHSHHFAQSYSIQRALQENSILNIPIILTSHSPESAGLEYSNNFRRNGIPGHLTDALENAVRKIEHLSFKGADIWIFPTPGAMDPYYETVHGFERLAKNKDIRFVTTGACKPLVTLSKKEAKAKFGMSNKTVVSFIGRHNSVKGYDIFIDALQSIISENPQIGVLVAGSENSEFEAPNHPNWVELGWVENPGEVLRATDVFVLPNRMTYFDIVLIEALAMGTVVVASATGGNKSVHELTNGAITLFDTTVGDLKVKLKKCIADEEKCIEKNQMIQYSYEKMFTPKIFAKEYIRTIQSVWTDYGLLRQ